MNVTINQKAVLRIKKGHPWIFRSDLTKVCADQPGTVDVLSPNGKLLGQALFSPCSQISLRMMTRGDEKITSGLIKGRLERALELRKNLYPGSTFFRVVYGEADGLPSLLIDRFEDVLVLQTLSAGMETFKESILRHLKELLQPRSVIERNDVAIRQKEGLPLIRQVCYGEDPGDFPVEFGGMKFFINPMEGQKTGFFLDQRFNALRSARYAGGEVLDAFSYSGQFAIRAAGHADHVECIDTSVLAIREVLKNAELNQLKNIRAQEANVFDFLRMQDEKKNFYDTVFLDPPAFVKGKSGLAGALRGYKEINLRAMRLLKPGGVLVTSSCSQNLTQIRFEAILGAAAQDARRRAKVLEVLGQPADHPWLLSAPETHYLKCYILKME